MIGNASKVLQEMPTVTMDNHFSKNFCLKKTKTLAEDEVKDLAKKKTMRVKKHADTIRWPEVKFYKNWKRYKTIRISHLVFKNKHLIKIVWKLN